MKISLRILSEMGSYSNEKYRRPGKICWVILSPKICNITCNECFAFTDKIVNVAFCDKPNIVGKERGFKATAMSPVPLGPLLHTHLADPHNKEIQQTTTSYILHFFSFFNLTHMVDPHKNHLPHNNVFLSDPGPIIVYPCH